jgi:hypothetical protein
MTADDMVGNIWQALAVGGGGGGGAGRGKPGSAVQVATIQPVLKVPMDSALESIIS